MKYLIHIPLFLLLSSCSIVPDNVVSYCAQFDDGYIDIYTDTNKYRSYSSYNSSLHNENPLIKDISTCSDVNILCLDGPFYLKAKKSEIKLALEKKGKFSKLSRKGNNLYGVYYSSNEGLYKFNIIHNYYSNKLNKFYKGKEKKSGIIFERCGFDIDKYHFNLRSDI